LNLNPTQCHWDMWQLCWITPGCVSNKGKLKSCYAASESGRQASRVAPVPSNNFVTSCHAFCVLFLFWIRRTHCSPEAKAM
jgi:hypothetical protein